MARSFTITQDGESRSFTIETGVGPTGPAGSAASVTNANVNTAIETDPAATRESLGLPLNNFTSTRAPLATDDSSDGYEAGSRWIDTEELIGYECLDATLNNAEWALLTLSVDEVQGMIDAAFDPYGIGAMTGTVTLDRSNGPIQYGNLTGNTTLVAPSNGSQGQQLSITFSTTGTWTLNFTDIQFDFDTTGLLPITLEANKAYSLDLRVQGSYWAFDSISGSTAINATINPALTLVYDANGFINQYSLTSIPYNWKFGDSDISDLVIGTAVTRIKDQAFYGCYSLGSTITNLVIPNNVTAIGRRAFRDCYGYAGTLTLSTAMTRIERGTFRNCNALTGSLSFPSGMTYIGINAFYNCSSMTGDLTIPSTVTEIGEGAFYGMTGIGNDLIISALTITIGEESFKNCSSITNINAQCTLTAFGTNSLLGTGVTTIHARAADTTWTAGAGITIAGKTGVTVTKDL